MSRVVCLYTTARYYRTMDSRLILEDFFESQGFEAAFSSGSPFSEYALSLESSDGIYSALKAQYANRLSEVLKNGRVRFSAIDLVSSRNSEEGFEAFIPDTKAIYQLSKGLSTLKSEGDCQVELVKQSVATQVQEIQDEIELMKCYSGSSNQQLSDIQTTFSGFISHQIKGSHG